MPPRVSPWRKFELYEPKRQVDLNVLYKQRAFGRTMHSFRESKPDACSSDGELNPLQRVATTIDESANVAQRLSREQKQKEFPDLPVSDPVA